MLSLQPLFWLRQKVLAVKSAPETSGTGEPKSLCTIKRVDYARIIDVLVIAVTSLILILTCLVRTPLIYFAPSLLHMPDALAYSDILSLFSRIFMENSQISLSNQNISNIVDAILRAPVPFRDYFMEYPPISSGLVYVATVLSYTSYASGLRTLDSVSLSFSVFMTIASYISVYLTARRLISGPVTLTPLVSIFIITMMSQIPHVFFYTIAITVVSFLAVAQAHMIEIAKRLELSTYRTLYVALSPSMLIFAVYNFDIIMLALTLIGVEYFLFRENREKTGLILLGASVATKIVTAPAILVSVVARSRSIREFFEKELYVALIPSLAFLAVIAVSLNGFMSMLKYHSTFGCEDCIWLPLVGDLYSESSLHRIMYTVTLVVTVIIGLIISKRMTSEHDLLKLFTWVLTGTVVFNYIFPPQFVIEILPLLALVVSEKLLLLLVVADVFNIVAGIKCIEVAPYGFTWGSPQQNLFFLRNILLLFIFLVLGWSLVSRLFNHPKEVHQATSSPLSQPSEFTA